MAQKFVALINEHPVTDEIQWRHHGVIASVYLQHYIVGHVGKKRKAICGVQIMFML